MTSRPRDRRRVDLRAKRRGSPFCSDLPRAAQTRDAVTAAISPGSGARPCPLSTIVVCTTSSLPAPRIGPRTIRFSSPKARTSFACRPTAVHLNWWWRPRTMKGWMRLSCCPTVTPCWMKIVAFVTSPHPSVGFWSIGRTTPRDKELLPTRRSSLEQVPNDDLGRPASLTSTIPPLAHNPPSSVVSLEPGHQLAHYEVLELLGKGESTG